MASPRYRVVLTSRPKGWQPMGPDDVPPQVAHSAETGTETSELLEAVEGAVQFNQQPARQQDRQWAIVVDPDSPGRTSPAGRLATPLRYRVEPIWWPDGWEPHSALDVPNCAWQFHESAAADDSMPWERALATVRSLNGQCLAAPGSLWYVVVAVENEPLSQTVSFDPSGRATVVELRRLHVIRPDPRGAGDCAACPGRTMPCAAERWRTKARQFTTTRSPGGAAARK